MVSTGPMIINHGACALIILSFSSSNITNGMMSINYECIKSFVSLLIELQQKVTNNIKV